MPLYILMVIIPNKNRSSLNEYYSAFYSLLIRYAAISTAIILKARGGLGNVCL